MSILHKSDPFADIRLAIRDRQEFTPQGLLSASPFGISFLGELPEHWHECCQGDNAEYAVYSGFTPIAWFGSHGWVVPPVKYNIQVSHHQTVVIEALQGHITKVQILETIEFTDSLEVLHHGA